MYNAIGKNVVRAQRFGIMGVDTELCTCRSEGIAYRITTLLNMLDDASDAELAQIEETKALPSFLKAWRAEVQRLSDELVADAVDVATTELRYGSAPTREGA